MGKATRLTESEYQYKPGDGVGVHLASGPITSLRLSDGARGEYLFTIPRNAKTFQIAWIEGKPMMRIRFGNNRTKLIAPATTP